MYEVHVLPEDAGPCIIAHVVQLLKRSTLIMGPVRTGECDRRLHPPKKACHLSFLRVMIHTCMLPQFFLLVRMMEECRGTRARNYAHKLLPPVLVPATDLVSHVPNDWPSA